MNLKKPMNFKKILGISLFVGGIVLVIISHYIAGRVAEGRQEIGSAQKKVDSAKELFSFAPPAKPLGEGLTGSAQKKIDAGSKEADEYERLSMQLRVGGYILAAAGIIVFAFSLRRKG